MEIRLLRLIQFTKRNNKKTVLAIAKESQRQHIQGLEERLNIEKHNPDVIYQHDLVELNLTDPVLIDFMKKFLDEI